MDRNATRDGAIMLAAGALFCVMGVALLIFGGGDDGLTARYGSLAHTGKLFIGLGGLTMMVGGMTFFGSQRVQAPIHPGGDPA